MPSKGFVSYSHRDRDFADCLIARLQALGQRRGLAFWSTRDLAAGEDWGDHLRDTVGRADFIVAIMSQAALNSTSVMSELGAALGRQTPILVVVPPHRAVDYGRYLGPVPAIRAGTRPIGEVAEAVLDRVQDLVSNPAAA